jgi:hypothetical protein
MISRRSSATRRGRASFSPFRFSHDQAERPCSAKGAHYRCHPSGEDMRPLLAIAIELLRLPLARRSGRRGDRRLPVAGRRDIPPRSQERPTRGFNVELMQAGPGMGLDVRSAGRGRRSGARWKPPIDASAACSTARSGTGWWISVRRI